MISKKNQLTKEELTKSIMAINAAISILGSQAKLADSLGIPNQNISEMARGKRILPIHHAISIENITKGGVKKSLLRPDQF